MMQRHFTWSTHYAARLLRAIAAPPRQQHRQRQRLRTAVWAPALALSWHSGFCPSAPGKLVPTPAQQKLPLGSSLKPRVHASARMYNGKVTGLTSKPVCRGHHASRFQRYISLYVYKSLVDKLDAPAKWFSLELPSQTSTRVPAAAHRVEARVAASAPHLALHGLLHAVMCRLGALAAARTSCGAAEQQRRHNGCGC